jgi:hypothetical protein
MADVTKIRPAGGSTTYDIKDTTARNNANTANTNEEYDRQVLCGVYEGRNIATIPELASEISSAGSVYAFLHARAQAKNAAKLRLGDYIDVTPTSSTVNKGQAIRYRIAGIGHCYKFGSPEYPWAFWMVPDNGIDMTGSSYAVNTSNILWNTTATNNGTAEQQFPYLASNLHAWEIGEFLPALPTALQNVIVTHKILLEKRYSADGALEDSTGWDWGDVGKIFSLSETEVYGQCVWGTKGWSVGADAQLPLFALAPWRRTSGNRVHRWLRSVRSGSASDVCYVNYYGYASYNSAATTNVRPWPCFLLG